MPPLDPKEEAIVAAHISNGGDQTAAWSRWQSEVKSQAENDTRRGVEILPPTQGSPKDFRAAI